MWVNWLWGCSFVLSGWEQITQPKPQMTPFYVYKFCCHLWFQDSEVPKSTGLFAHSWKLPIVGGIFVVHFIKSFFIFIFIIFLCLGAEKWWPGSEPFLSFWTERSAGSLSNSSWLWPQWFNQGWEPQHANKGKTCQHQVNTNHIIISCLRRCSWRQLDF